MREVACLFCTQFRSYSHPNSLTITRFSTALSLSIQRDSTVLGRPSKRKGREKIATLHSQSIHIMLLHGKCQVVDKARERRRHSSTTGNSLEPTLCSPATQLASSALVPCSLRLTPLRPAPPVPDSSLHFRPIPSRAVFPYYTLFSLH